MALLWERTSGGRRYEVRTAGRTIRLYTNGVLHTQYHPGHIFGGGVWDLLGLPVLWRDSSRLNGILLLGLGGGAVVRQLNELVDWDRLVAVDRNPVHVRIARGFFGLDRIKAELVEADAGQWIGEHRGEKFDLVIDDLFSDGHGEAARAVTFSRDWYRGLRDLVAEDGILVVNFADSRDLVRRLKRIPAVRRDFERIYKFTLPAYGNAVAVLLRRDRTPADLTKALEGIRPKRRRARLRYHLEKIEF
ncbi:MAG: hypothetical protein WAL83_14690 [Arenicellales bacterium]